MKLLKTIFLAFFLLQINFGFSTYYKIGAYQSGNGSVTSIDIQGELLYSVTNTKYFEIIDISDPENPNELGSVLLTDGTIWKLEVAGDFAYVVYTYHIKIVDVSDPNNPFITGTIYQSVTDIIISNDLAYLSGGDFKIYDISNPQEPILKGLLDYGFFLTDISLNDTLIYGVSSGNNNSLHIINISDPSNPIHINNSIDLSIGGDAGIECSDSHAFIAYDRFLYSINVSDPINPIVLDTIYVEENTKQLVIQNQKAILNNTSSGIKVVDISDPSHLSDMGFYDSPGSTAKVKVKDEIAYLSDGGAGVQFINISDPSPSFGLSRFQTYSKAEGIAASGNYLYLAEMFNGMDIINIENPQNPTLINRKFNGLGWPVNMSLNQNHLCFCLIYPSPQILFIDISSPTQPILLNTIYLNSTEWYEPIELFMTENHLFVGVDARLEIYDITDFSNATLISNYNGTSLITDIHVEDDMAYISTGNHGVEIINLENLLSPYLLFHYNTSGFAHQLNVVSEKLLIADGISGLQIIDISDPSLPVQMDSILPHSNSNITVKPLIVNNNMIIFDREWNEISTYDISDFDNIQLQSSLKQYADIDKLIYHAGCFIASVKYYGLLVFDDTPILSIKKENPMVQTKNISIYPNPTHSSSTISFSIENNSKVEVEFYNQIGELVKTIDKGQLRKGTHKIVWHGKDEQNNKVLPGMYICKIRINKQMMTKPFIVI